MCGVSPASTVIGFLVGLLGVPDLLILFIRPLPELTVVTFLGCLTYRPPLFLELPCLPAECGTLDWV